ncbi:hypothetical protein HK102_011945, partial [Quaeritorhiza haematococci]
IVEDIATRLDTFEDFLNMAVAFRRSWGYRTIILWKIQRFGRHGFIGRINFDTCPPEFARLLHQSHQHAIQTHISNDHIGPGPFRLWMDCGCHVEKRLASLGVAKGYTNFQSAPLFDHALLFGQFDTMLHLIEGGLVDNDTIGGYFHDFDDWCLQRPHHVIPPRFLHWGILDLDRMLRLLVVAAEEELWYHNCISEDFFLVLYQNACSLIAAGAKVKPLRQSYAIKKKVPALWKVASW